MNLPNWWPCQQTRDAWAELFGYCAADAAEQTRILAACILSRQPGGAVLRMVSDCLGETANAQHAATRCYGLASMARVFNVAAEHAEAQPAAPTIFALQADCIQRGDGRPCTQGPCDCARQSVEALAFLLACAPLLPPGFAETARGLVQQLGELVR